MIAITTPDTISHVLETNADGEPDYEAYSSSPNTVQALSEAYNRGDWEPYTPSPPQMEPPPPDWSTFRLALMQSTNFRAWSEQLPDSWREDLKMAALVANAEALQSTYDHCKTISPPGHIIAEGWQEIADANRIPVTF